MQLFHWRSEALKQYGDGWIVVQALDIDEARAKVRVDADTHFWQGTWWSRDRDDEDDREEHTKFMKQIDADIAGEPETSNTLFILGSE